MMNNQSYCSLKQQLFQKQTPILHTYTKKRRAHKLDSSFNSMLRSFPADSLGRVFQNDAGLFELIPDLVGPSPIL